MYRKQGMYKSTAEQLSAALKLNTIEPGGAIPYSSPSSLHRSGCSLILKLWLLSVANP